MKNARAVPVKFANQKAKAKEKNIRTAMIIRKKTIDKVVRLFTAAALAIVFFLIIIAVLRFFSFAFAFWLANFTGTALAFLIVAVLHLLLFILFFTFRKSWIEKPLVHFLASLFLSK